MGLTFNWKTPQWPNICCFSVTPSSLHSIFSTPPFTEPNPHLNILHFQVLRVPCSKPAEPCAECSEAAKVQTGAPQVDMLCYSTDRAKFQYK